jgi:hypothetical protein
MYGLALLTMELMHVLSIGLVFRLPSDLCSRGIHSNL